jgi:hypothetical protein
MNGLAYRTSPRRRHGGWRLVVLLAAVVAGAPAAAQPPLPGVALAEAGMVVERYTFARPEAAGMASVTLLTAPLAARAELGRGVSVEVSGVYAYGVVERRDGSWAHLHGFTDTQLSVARAWGGDRLTLALVALLPTGHATHTAEEARVADAVAADVLPFRITNWGTGGGVGFRAAYAGRAAGFGVRLSGGYLVAGDFEPIDGQEEPLRYRPGNEATLKAAVDRKLGRGVTAMLQAAWQRFADDELGGRNLYRAGDRLQVVASCQGASGAARWLAYAGLQRRERGTSFEAAVPGTPVQALWLGGAGVWVPLGRVALTPSVDARLFRSEDGRGQGWYAGAGATAELEAGRVMLVPGARARFGRLVAEEGVESRVGGVEVGLTLRYRRR